ncbi:MAG: hypothetical protein HZB76_06975 [Chlamydiae bacterium]|nr:hypothetical protein [Chlamydiota bacterium]
MTNRLAYLLYKNPANEQGNRYVGVLDAECTKSLGPGLINKYAFDLQIAQRDGLLYQYKFTVEAGSDKDAMCIMSALGQQISKTKGFWDKKAISCQVNRDKDGKVEVVLKLDGGDSEKIELPDDRLLKASNVLKQFKVESGENPAKRTIERLGNLQNDLQAAQNKVMALLERKDILEKKTRSNDENKELELLKAKPTLKNAPPLRNSNGEEYAKKSDGLFGKLGKLGNGIRNLGPVKNYWFAYRLEDLPKQIEQSLKEVNDLQKEAIACRDAVGGLYVKHKEFVDKENNKAAYSPQELVQLALQKAEIEKQIIAAISKLKDIKELADKVDSLKEQAESFTQEPVSS